MNRADEFLFSQAVDGSPDMAWLMPPMNEATRLIVACRPADFSASALARAIEDTNAQLVNLNVTAGRLDDGRMAVELRTNQRNASAAVRSLQRYGFEVVNVDAPADAQPDAADEMLRSRAANLLHLLEI